MNPNSKNKSAMDWKKKVFLFLSSQTVSLFGSSLVQYALIWYIAKNTNSGAMVTISTICSFVPQIFISLYGGVWADRYSRKKLIILADGSIAASTLVLAVMMSTGSTDLWMMFLVSAIRSLGSGIQGPAVNSLIPQIVPEEHLMRVNSINGSIQSFVNLVSPAIGGGLLSFGAFHNVLYIDVVTAVIGISILSVIPIPLHKKAAQTSQNNAFTDLKEGIQYAFSSYFIKYFLLAYVFIGLMFVPAAFLNVLFVTRVFGDSYFYLTLNEMAFFVGAALGGIGLAYWGGFKNRLHTLLLSCFGFGITTFVIGFVNIFWIYLIVIGLTGVSMAMMNSPVMVLLQEKTDPDMHGRIFSLIQIIMSGVMPLGMLIFGPLADKIPIQWLMIGSGLMLIFFSFCISRRKRFMAEGIKPNNEKETLAEASAN